MEFQPFMNRTHLQGCDALLLHSAQKNKRWTQWLSAEQTAYALGQVTAARALPTLTEFVSTAALLDSRIRLRDYLDASLVNAITITLNRESEMLQWKQVEATSYACVIGAGAAVCVDTTLGDEMVYLRYANHIADAIAQAQNEKELPRSLLGLQINLQETIDTLLTYARSRTLLSLVP
jgi:translation initiation factor 2B subunit (eIF-2B alpha/beta/delta family)